ncbi:hypothetical protein V1514DRAFT_331738 [Lipomyces japonicus]|uniref:uncharacterized protein n=1 Tax=Lipomyces japonicus TaxID=56871 RepID=UPI0034CD068B
MSLHDRPAKRRRVIAAAFEDYESNEEIDQDQLESGVQRSDFSSRKKPHFLPGKDDRNIEENHKIEELVTKPQLEEQDDYMTMEITDAPRPRSVKTYSELRKEALRKQEIKSKPIAPHIIQRDKLNEGLDRSLLAETTEDKQPGVTADERLSFKSKNIALNIMMKMGFMPGKSLGKATQGLQEPLRPKILKDRGGVGMESALRKKLQEDYDQIQAQSEADKSDFISRKRQEVEEKKILKQLNDAQKVCRELDTLEDPRLDESMYTHSSSKDVPTVKSINFLWRELILERENEHYERMLKKSILDRTVDNSNMDSSNLFKQDTEPESNIEQLTPQDFMDAELEAFLKMNVKEKFSVVLEYLRQKYLYCLWCGCRYEDQSDLDQNCPGYTEEDHN